MKLSEIESYQKLRRIVEYSNAFDTEAAAKEIEALHLGRKSRNLVVKRLTGHKIAEVSLQDQSYRSRLVEIMMVATKQYQMLSAAYDAAVDRIGMDMNSSLLDRGLRSIGDRTTFVKSRLQFASQRLCEINLVIELAQMVIADIDAGGWSLKRTFESLQISSVPERHLG